MTEKTWLNSNCTSDNVLYIKVQGNYQLCAVLINSVSIPGVGNWDGTLTTNGNSLATLQGLVSDFVNQAGYPWMVIGDITTGNGVIAAVNLAKVYSIQAGTNGLIFNSTSAYEYTSGYAPWGSYADARAAILELQGNYSF